MRDENGQRHRSTGRLQGETSKRICGVPRMTSNPRRKVSSGEGGPWLGDISTFQEKMSVKNCWHLFVRHTSVVEPSESIHTALKIMAHRGFRHLPVVNRERSKEVLGIISAQDLIDLISVSGGEPFEIRGTPEEAENKLLSRLQKGVSTIMNDKPVTISSTDTILDAIRLMSEKNIGALPIVQEERVEERRDLAKTKATARGTPVLAGIITLRDIISMMAAFAPFGLDCDEVMTSHPATVVEEDTIYTAVNTMRQNRVRRLPVVSSRDRGRVRGMVTNKIIIRYFESGIAYNYLKVGINTAYRQAVGTVMMSTPLIDPKEDCGTVAYLMRELGTGGFPVMDSRGLVGIITERDLVKRVYEKEGLSFFSDLLFSKPQTIYA
jgi:CBS domain-containing protein